MAKGKGRRTQRGLPPKPSEPDPEMIARVQKAIATGNQRAEQWRRVRGISPEDMQRRVNI